MFNNCLFKIFKTRLQSNKRISKTIEEKCVYAIILNIKVEKSKNKYMH